jgi:hypothetical protein
MNYEAISIKYEECVCACVHALVVQHENRIFSARDCIVISGGSGCTFFHIIS